MKKNWEMVNDEKDLEKTQRLRVFGGWLIITTIRYNSNGVIGSMGRYYTEPQCALSQTFVPDPNHEWEI